MEITDYAVYDDRTLTRMVNEGDNRAFDCLFARHRDAIYSMLVKRTNNTNDVEDLMQ